MRRPPHGDGSGAAAGRPVPLDGSAIRRLRAQLGLTHGHVAHAMRVSYGLAVRPETVAAWERGDGAPTAAQLPALAGALWCAPRDLMTVPRTLLEHRLAAGLAAADLARAVGMGEAQYARAEARGRWEGNARQTAALAAALGLGPRALLTATGGEPRLAELLRQAVGTRWQPYVRPVAALTGLDRPRAGAALRRLHAGYQAVTLPTLAWSPTAAPTPAATEGDTHARDFLTTLPARFWTALP